MSTRSVIARPPDGDFTATPGYRTGHHPEDLRNQSYCHGDRHQPPRRR